MYPEKQVFLILGLSRSGRSATEFLLARGAVVYIYDDAATERVEKIALQLEKQGAKRVAKERLFELSNVCDALVLSPGIPIDHPLAVAFKRKRKAVVGETELAARYIKSPVVAVTGTNGKTTTVSMLCEVLKKGGYDAKACGNIGTPMIEFCALGEKGVAVAEISSFQLETLNSLCPHVAVVLNVTEDHLNRHYNMENYVFLKSKLLKNSTETEFVVLNHDDPIVRGFAEKTKAQIVWFSTKERVRGAYLSEGALYFNGEKILASSDMLTEGLHNVQNALACVAAAKIMGVKNADIASVLASFKGIKHRIEYVGTYNGVAYIDDSKGTNVDATVKAVNCMKKSTLLLLGGKDKGYPYAKLFAALKRSVVRHAVLYGENRYALLASARENGFESVTVCENFTVAVQVASLLAKPDETVLLSPASASFDEFAGYEERGERFVEIIRTLAAKTVPPTAQTDGKDGNAETVDGADGEVAE